MASIKKHKLITKSKLLEVFKECDTDRNGVLSYKEVSKMLIKINVPANQVMDIISKFDTDKDGQISQEEFIDAMMDMK
jgi:Ca2+-binding EF-hand superfamily protein